MPSERPLRLRRAAYRLALFAAASALTATHAFAQVRVEGVVRRPDGSPLVGATVVLEPNDPRQTLKTTTDVDGAYVFARVVPGQWVRLSASEAGRVLVNRVALVTQHVERVDLDILAPPTPHVSAPAETAPPAAAKPAEPAVRTATPSPPEQKPAPKPPPAPPPPPNPVLTGSGGVSGVVRSADGLAIPGATVTVDGTTRFAVTDTEGRYTVVGLRPDAHVTLVASLPGFVDARVDVLVPRGSPAPADFVLQLPAYTDQVTVRAEVPMLNVSSGTSQVTLRPEQVASLPSLGEKDLFRALQLMPGVTGTQEASSGLYVRGGTPDQNLVTLDAFTLYHVDHLFGYFSAFNMDAVRQVEFSKTALNAADGGRLSGILRLTGKAGEGQPTGFLNVSMLSTGGLFSLPVGKKASFLVAGRRSYQSPLYDSILGLVSTSSSPGRPPGGGGPFGGGAFATTPRSSFYDLDAKVHVTPTTRDDLAGSVYGGRDDVNNSRSLDLTGFTFPSFTSDTTEATTGLPSDPVFGIKDVRNWRNRGAGAVWTHQWSNAATTTASFGYSRYDDGRQSATTVTSKSTGEDYSFTSGRGGNGAQDEHNDVEDRTMRLTNAFGLGRSHRMSTGAEMTTLHVGYSAQTAAVVGPGPGGGVASGLVALLRQSGTGRLSTVYAQDSWNPLARLVLTAGVRASTYNITHDTFVEPRIRFNYQLTPRVQFKGGYGIYHQVIGKIQYEDLSQGDREFWALSDGSTVPTMSSRQVVAGASYETEGFLLDTEVYDKQLNGLTLFAPRLTPGEIPDEDSTFLYYGSGRAQGLETLFQKKFGNNTGWVSYTQSVAEELFPELQAGYFRASYDQNYELKAADTLKVNDTWTLGATWAFGSGKPYTPATGIETVRLPFGDISVNRIVFGDKNSALLPVYHRLDVSTQGDLRLLGVKSTVGVTVFNLYGRQNVWYRTYQAFGGSGVANDVTLMGRAINAFIKVGF